MKMSWRISLGAAALLGAVAFAFILKQWQQNRREWEQAQVIATFTGDAAAFEALRASTDRVVPLLEDFLEHQSCTSREDIERCLGDLASADTHVWRLALARLTLLPASAQTLLQARYDAAEGSLFKERLKPLIANRAKIQQQISGFLTGLYSQYFHRLFVSRRTQLLRNCQDAPAQLFFAYAPFAQVWTMLQNSPPEARLRFLLLRLLAERDEDALECLERFPGSDVLRVAAETWWPVEIEPLAPDGAYQWTTRAATTHGNVATRVLRLSVRGGSKSSSGEWLHLDRWSRWTYVFRFRTPILNEDAVVYAEGRNRKSNQSWRANPARYREKAVGAFWLPGNHGAGAWCGPGRCETVRGVPASAQVPVVALTKAEEGRWHNGKAFDWARPLFPAGSANQVQFVTNAFPAPTIYPTLEAALKDRPRRSRRRR